MTGRPIDREHVLRLVDHFQVSGVVWRHDILRTHAQWARAIREGTEPEVASWLAECERLAHAEVALGVPLTNRVEIIDNP